MALAMSLAMWMDEATSLQWIMVFVGIIAAFFLIMLIAMAAVAAKAFKSVRDAAALAEEIKNKMMPLVDEATALTRSSRTLLEESTPKIKIVIENVVNITETAKDTSLAAKAAVLNVQGTVTDASTRAQKQVARVDGLVTNAITTTAEIFESINRGIRGPVRKIAEVATEAKYVAEGLLDKIKSFAGAAPFGKKETPRAGTAGSSPVPPPSGNRPGTPGSPTGSGGPREPIAVP